MAAHPAVALAAAVGMPDAYAGELPVCYVALRPGATATEAGEVTVRHIGVAVDSRCSGLTVLAVAIPQSDGSATWQVGSPGRSCT